MKSFRVLASLLALTVCRLADAGIITIDPARYAAGTDLSHATPGVALSTWTRTRDAGTYSEPTYSNVYAADCLTSCGALEGRRIFGGGYYDDHPIFTDAVRARFYLDGDDPTLRGVFSVFRADFDSPTNFVQLLMGGLGGGDPPAVYAFDREGNEITQCVLSFSAPCGIQITGNVFSGMSLLTLYTSTDNIAFIVAGGAAAGSRVAALTFLQTSVPEPAPLGLLVCGLIGVWAASRRKERTAAQRRGTCLPSC